MNGRTYTEDALYLYDQFDRKYSKATYIATGFLPAPVEMSAEQIMSGLIQHIMSPQMHTMQARL